MPIEKFVLGKCKSGVSDCPLAQKLAQWRIDCAVRRARVAKLADAPDLGIPNQRFQSITFRFNKKRIYERKIRFFALAREFTRD
jgi:hypothetical protein